MALSGELTADQKQEALVKAKEMYSAFSNMALDYVHGKKCAKLACDYLIRETYHDEKCYFWEEVKNQIHIL